jgi:hypothetical protein
LTCAAPAAIGRERGCLERRPTAGEDLLAGSDLIRGEDLLAGSDPIRGKDLLAGSDPIHGEDLFAGSDPVVGAGEPT